jgi:squalene cyclase
MITSNIEQKIVSASIGLTSFIHSALEAQMEVRRINLCTLALIRAGVLPRGELFSRVARYVVGHQQQDGGWTDVDESTLSVKLLSLIEPVNLTAIDKGKKWLRLQQNTDGGWGRTGRDISRIPVTGFLLHFLPVLSNSSAVKWLKKEWANDFAGETRLTYKGGFFLLGLSAAGVTVSECPLIQETYVYLAAEQNDDGGFGPWKNHPIGSDPWSTGIVLMGMLTYPQLIKKEVIKKTVNWLAENQLPNGFWPYHYMEEGSSYAYMGLVAAVRYLS